MKTLYSTISERGQTSIPADLRKIFGLKTGQRLIWQASGQNEIKIKIEPATAACLGPKAMLGYASRLRPLNKIKTTDEIIKELREGED